MDGLSGFEITALGGLLGGVLLGYAARVGRFCTLGAIEDALYGDSFDRLRMWALALGLSIIGCAGLVASGVLDRADLFIVRDGFSPIAASLGGVLFGYGMALAGTCGYGALARLGTGDMRAFVLVMILGISTYASLFGPLAPLRLALFSMEFGRINAPVTMDGLVSNLTGVSSILVASLIGAGFCVLGAWSGQRRKAALWGSLVAVGIVTGWGITAWVAQTSFDPVGVRSHNFSAPVGESIAWVMMSSVRPVGFATGSVIGVVIGSALGSWRLSQFRWEACEDPRELKRQVAGAVFMGFGATLALGCSVGQGLSAFAVLTLSAPIVCVSIFVGAAVGLRHLIFGWPGFRSLQG
ncbi:YeeE/YedE family protein [Tropicimonas sp. S265A]|uniref:YeeE/YedE family protein n=1 Tax=Tropicimonas sp. S265A TaxID=3415134 RepID=UPI003C7B805C